MIEENIRFSAETSERILLMFFLCLRIGWKSMISASRVCNSVMCALNLILNAYMNILHMCMWTVESKVME